MTREGLIEQLILWSLIGEANGDNISLSDYLERWNVSACRRLRFEGAALGVALPTEPNLLEYIGQLLDDELIISWSAPDVWSRPTRVEDLKRSVSPQDSVFVGLTPTGLKEAEAFDKALNEYPIRQIRQAMSGQYLMSQLGHLVFEPVLPTHLPEYASVLPHVDPATTPDYLKMTYSSVEGTYQGPALVVEETLEKLRDRWPDGELRSVVQIDRTSVQDERIDIASNWKAHSLTWKHQRLTIRVVSSWSVPEPAKVSLSQELIDETFRVARSMITPADAHAP